MPARRALRDLQIAVEQLRGVPKSLENPGAQVIASASSRNGHCHRSIPSVSGTAKTPPWPGATYANLGATQYSEALADMPDIQPLDEHFAVLDHAQGLTGRKIMSPSTGTEPHDSKTPEVGSPAWFRQDAEQKLRKAAEQYRQAEDPEAVKAAINEAERQALRMIAHDPAHSAGVPALLKELLPLRPDTPDSPTKS